MSDKIFCGNGKEHKFNNGGSVVKVMLDLDDLIANFEEHGFTTEQGKKKIKIIVSSKKDGADQFGKTHNIEIDTWKPEQQKEPNPFPS